MKEFILFLPFLLSSSVADVISCGGFIHTLGNADRSQIKVRLLTPEGNQKYETSCNPANGYFMIPIYSKGNYKFQVKAPKGWIFEKEFYEVTVDGKTDPCSKGLDIDFKQSGYSISGKVRSGDIGGPRGFKLGLYSNDGKLKSEAVTDAQGDYVFYAEPGQYSVYHVDQEAQCIERGQIPVTLADAPVVVTPDITISGYLLTVQVYDDGAKGLPDAAVTLFSKKKVEINTGIDRQARPQFSQTSEGFAYTLKTDANGRTRFPCLPPGEYSVSVVHETNGIKLSFLPSVKALTMKSSNEKVEFTLSGFQTFGQVQAASKPVAGATFLLNGRRMGDTDTSGKVLLTEIKSGSYRVTAEKKHYVFNTVTANLSPKSPTLFAVQAEKVDVCGILRVERSQLGDAKVVLESTESTRVFETSVDSQGSFCLSVPVGKYRARVQNIPPVTPDVTTVDASSEPVLNLLFTQFKADVEVGVQCLGTCDGYTVILNGPTGIIESKPVTGSLVFTGVSPGSYFFTVKGAVQACWEQERVEFQVDDQNVAGLKFKQTGYRMFVDTAYAAELAWRLSTDASNKGVAKVSSSQRTFCLPTAGTHKVDISSCHVFEPSSFEIRVPSTDPIKLVAKKALVSAVVQLDQQSNDVFKAQLRGGNLREPIVLEASSSESRKYFSHHIAMESVGQKFEIVPQSDTYIFSPTSHSFVFDGNCNNALVTFQTQKGVFLEGAISPPVDGVDVTATNDKDSAMVFKGRTGKDGRFRIGPVLKSIPFSVAVNKVGYRFIKQSGYNFQAVKLSELRVSFIDSETKKPLADVLTSISGVDNFRSNNMVGPEGVYNYIDLRPGEYFIIAILQEYAFENSPTKIVVKEGEVVSVTLEGKRFAYSVYGKLSYLNGDPIPNLPVEAISANCGNLQEDDVTNEAGAYRIRGLKPECEYKIIPKLVDDKFGVYPPFIKTLVKKEDRKGVDFVVTSSKQSVEVFGRVILENHVNVPLAMKVAMRSNGKFMARTDLAKPSGDFFFVSDDLQVGDVVSIDVEDGRNNVVMASRELRINSSFISTTIEVSYQQKVSDVVISGNSYIGLLFVGFIAYIFLNPEKIKPMLEHCQFLWQFLQQISIKHEQVGGADDNDRKRRTRR